LEGLFLSRESVFSYQVNPSPAGNETVKGYQSVDPLVLYTQSRIGLLEVYLAQVATHVIRASILAVNSTNLREFPDYLTEGFWDAEQR
jgi:hypothetical protein